ncbi:MAG: alpha/beta fold hydrolase [Thermoguttaceae bacterium]
MMCQEPHFLFLPGLGADRRLFAPQQRVFPDLCVPQWLPSKPGEGLDSYAARLAARVVFTRPLILGGCSFGGFVALEMARILRPSALVLIGSASARREIPICLRALSVMSSVIPAKAFIIGRLVAQPMARFFGLRENEHRVLFVEMLRDVSVEFLQWGCASVYRWRPEPISGVPLFAIHGAEDRILPHKRRSVDVTLDGAGHLLTLTHAERVNEFLLAVKIRVAEAAKG